MGESCGNIGIYYPDTNLLFAGGESFYHQTAVPYPTTGRLPTYAEARLIPEFSLKPGHPNYIAFTTPSSDNRTSGLSIDPNNLRSLNEDVLKAGNYPFGTTRPSYYALTTGPNQNLKSEILNLSGHGSPIYITSPDISALSSLGPRGEHSILAKVTGTADFGKVIVHSPFAELDYFRAHRNTLKRIRFRLIFSSGGVVNLHGANWSFSIIFQDAE